MRTYVDECNRVWLKDKDEPICLRYACGMKTREFTMKRVDTEPGAFAGGYPIHYFLSFSF